MRKNILGLAFMAVALAGFSASAQNKNNVDCCGRNVCVEQKCDYNACNGNGKDCFSSKLFEGITLTDNQKKQITDLREECRADRAKKAAEYKKERATRDSIRREGARKNREAGFAARKSRLEGMKKILTPEQYVTFLENSLVYGHDKSMRKGHKGSFKRGKMSDKSIAKGKKSFLKERKNK